MKRIFFLIMIASLLASMLLVGTVMAAYYTPGAPAKFKIKLPDGSQFMDVTPPTYEPPTYDIGDKFNVTVSVENVTQMSAVGLTIVWNATFCNATGNWWPSPWLQSKIMAGEWGDPKIAFLTNDYDEEQQGGMMGVPLMGVLGDLGTTAFGVGYAVDGDFDIVIMEFQINTYGPSWFYVWKDAGTRESQIPQMYRPTSSGWQSPLGAPPIYLMPYDVVWAPGYTDVANAVLYVNPQRVGGVWVPVDKLTLLAPYIALASTILLATAATAIYVKRRKKKQ